jgi:hypothetical protein
MILILKVIKLNYLVNLLISFSNNFSFCIYQTDLLIKNKFLKWFYQLFSFFKK